MNERIKESVNELIDVVEDELCEECSVLKLVGKMADDVASEFELVKSLKGENECSFILDSMADLYAEDKEDEAIKVLYYFMKASGGKVSQYVLKLIIESDDICTLYFLDTFFSIENYVTGIVYYDDEEDEDDFEPLENEGWI